MDQEWNRMIHKQIRRKRLFWKKVITGTLDVAIIILILGWFVTGNTILLSVGCLLVLLLI